MDTELIKQMATDVNNVLVAGAKPYQERIKQLQTENKRLRVAMSDLLDACKIAEGYIQTNILASKCDQPDCVVCSKIEADKEKVRAAIAKLSILADVWGWK